MRPLKPTDAALARSKTSLQHQLLPEARASPERVAAPTQDTPLYGLIEQIPQLINWHILDGVHGHQMQRNGVVGCNQFPYEEMLQAKEAVLAMMPPPPSVPKKPRPAKLNLAQMEERDHRNAIAAARTAEHELVIRAISASGVPDADDDSLPDPYVVFSLLECDGWHDSPIHGSRLVGSTLPIRNARNPQWSQVPVGMYSMRAPVHAQCMPSAAPGGLRRMVPYQHVGGRVHGTRTCTCACDIVHLCMHLCHCK